ncbi:MAG: nucleoside triphosphate pyrophosphatase [Bdellovibrionales bacterium]
MKRLILASQSVYRKQQLESLGLAFDTESSNLDENSLKVKFKNDLERASLELAKAKAHNVFAKMEEKTRPVIGADQIASCEDLLLNKPGDFETAMRSLQKMCGKTVHLYSSVAIVSSDLDHSYTSICKLKMKQLTDLEIESYLKFAEPYDCAGSFKIEKGGIALFESIETDDYTGIMGLPLMQLSKLLTSIGYKLFNS